MMKFAVKQESFSGPLGLLLELLDKEELEIKDVHLARIADDFLSYMDAQEVPPNETADFLLIASKLIYLKSRELMPYLRIEDEDIGVSSLEDQLRLYRMFMRAADKLQERYESPRMIFMRPYVKIRKPEMPKFLAPTGTDAQKIREAFRWILKRLEPFFALQEASIERIKSVEERLVELKEAITSRASMKFREVIVGAKSKAEVVVSFLALLELVRRNIVRASQKTGHDIEINKI